MSESMASKEGWRFLARPVAALGRFFHDRDGSTAIEFAMLVLPFSLLVFAIIETCLAFAAQEVMANSADDVARQIRTGQIRTDTMTKEQLRLLICQPLQMIVSTGCPELKVDLRTDTFPALAVAAAKMPLKGTGAEREVDDAQMLYQPGKSMSKSMLRVFYGWPVMTDLLRQQMSRMKGGKTLLFAATTWQNEPY